MSAPRLPFLYPRLVRQGRVRVRLKRSTIQSVPRAFSIETRRHVEVGSNQRYGTANEPPPHLSTAATVASTAANAAHPTPPPAVDLTGQIGKDKASFQSVQQAAEAQEKSKRDKNATGGLEDVHDDLKLLSSGPKADEAVPTAASEAEERPVQGPYITPTNAMETVLQMPAPNSGDSKGKELPHLETPPYIHHFDTWSLVRDLEKGGFAKPSAVGLMKAMRLKLAENLDVARDALVSKSNVENESYLFKAACSELKTEITNNRKAETEKMRAHRTHLQHEVEILNQRMDQMMKGMKEELKGLFDDRKMNVKIEQRTMESRIQEINYKITVALNSDARSDVESIRWILTRRAVTALVIVAILVLGALRYNAYMMQTQEEERKRMKQTSTESTSTNMTDAATQISSPDLGLAGAASLADAQAAKESDGRGFVSLG